MKKKPNVLELLIWAALVSFVASQPAHSQATSNNSLFGDSTWSQSFDMGTTVAAGAPATGSSEASSGAAGDQSHQTIAQQKPAEPALSPKPVLDPAHNGNITAGSLGGMTSFPSGEYSFGFSGGGGSTSPFNTGLPTTSTGSVDINIVE